LPHLLRAHPHPRSRGGLRSPGTPGSACGLGGPDSPGAGWSPLCRCFPAQLLLFLLSVSAKLLTVQIPARREYRDRFTWLAGQIKAAALTPGQTAPAVQFRDIECAIPVTTFTSGHRRGAERRGSPGRSRGREGAGAWCPERRSDDGAADDGAADDGRPDGQTWPRARWACRVALLT
jgi:hypothetical protein